MKPIAIDPMLSLVFAACIQDASLIKYMHFDRETYRPLILRLVAGEKTDSALLSLWATALWTTVTLSVAWWDKNYAIGDLFAACDENCINDHESSDARKYSKAVHAHMLRLARKRKLIDLSATDLEEHQ